MTEDSILQRICREYLHRLKSLATKHGLGTWIEETIHANENGECSGTEEEVEELARLCDDERVNRTDVPDMLGVSYRYCFDFDIFDKLKKLRHVGIYSKVNTLLFKEKFKKDGNK